MAPGDGVAVDQDVTVGAATEYCLARCEREALSEIRAGWMQQDEAGVAGRKMEAIVQAREERRPSQRTEIRRDGRAATPAS